MVGAARCGSGALRPGWQLGLNHNLRMSARWWTLVVWALAAGSALFWGLKVFVKAAPLPPHTQTAAPAVATRGDLSRLLGADAPVAVASATPEPAADARFQLIGVVSPRSPQAAREGVALIAVDGQAPKAFRVGSVVDGQNVLQAVAARGATLGPRGGPALVALDLPPPAPAATGQLPASPSFAPAVVMPPTAVARPGFVPPVMPANGRRAVQPAPGSGSGKAEEDPLTR